MRLAGYVARVRERRGVYRIFVGNTDGTRPLGCPSIGERVKLNWIFKKWDVEAWTGLIWLRIRTVGGLL